MTRSSPADNQQEVIDGVVWREEWRGPLTLLKSASLRGDNFDDTRRILRITLRRRADAPPGFAGVLEAPNSHFVVPGQPEPSEGAYTIYRLYDDGTVLNHTDDVVVTVTGPVVLRPAAVAFSVLVKSLLAVRYTLSDSSVKKAVASFPTV